MFRKAKKGSNVISKDLNESIKTLSYLARAEKYFDLELNKNGQNTKPLLRIVDIIEALRRIHELTQQLEQGHPVPESAKSWFTKTPEIMDVVYDIMALNPKGLVTSDKVVLGKLAYSLEEARRLAGFAPVSLGSPNRVEEESAFLIPKSPVVQPAAPAPAPQAIQAEAQAPKPQPSLAEQFQTPAPAAPSYVEEPIMPRAEYKLEAKQEPKQEARQEYKLDQPLEWENNINFEEAEQAAAKISEEQPEAKETKKKKVVSIKQSKKDTASSAKSNLPQKYFATSYAGMNLQEGAEIVYDLAENPDNLEIVLLEHASRVKPVAQAKEIASDLFAIAPIAVFK